METVNQGQNATENEAQKTFTQDELNAILNDRLGRERAKYGDYKDLKAKAEKYDAMEEEAKSELQKATEKATALQSELDSLKKANQVRELREKVAKETGVPSALLTADDEEECKAQAKAITEFAKGASSYPNLRDGGEARGTIKNTTRQQFADWFNNQ